ncbi:MAG: hydrophobe/amphiphile efflux-3 (HAE3) family transporter [Hadesarchaea archaeon]|nr:hydrophobe/amphiphile efflux-3 (HAE3) family transporter [Hadesarchaea archaeon]
MSETESTETVGVAGGRRPYIILLCVFLISCFMAYGATNLSTSTEFREFLPEDSPAIKTTEEFESKFGSANTEIILVKAENVTKANVFRAIDELENGLRTNPELQGYIVEVKSYIDYVLPHLPVDIALLLDPQLENYIQLTLAQPAVANFVDRILSDDQSSALITVSTATGLSSEERARKTEAFIGFVNSFDENNENLALGVTGEQTLHNEIFGLMGRDNQVLIPAAAIFVVVVLFLVFRRLSDICIPLLVVGLGALWALGAMAWLGLRFTMIHVALVPLILGLGIDYSIHMLNRYYEERGKGAPTGRAIWKCTRTTGVAVALAAVTTMIGFGSFMVSDLPAIATLGAFAALGIAFAFLLSTTFLPAVLALRDRKGGKVKALVARRGKRVDKMLSAAAIGAERHGKLIVAVAVLVAAACAFSAYGIPTTMSFETFLPADIPAMVTLNEIEDQFGGQSVIVVLARGGVRTPEGLQAMFDLENAVLADGDNLITGSMSLASIISQTAGGIPPSEDAINAIIENENLLDPDQRSRVLSDNVAVIYFYVNAKTDQEMAGATRIIREHVRENLQNSIDLSIDGEPAVGGEPVIISEIVGTISSSMVRTTLLALLLCLAVLAVVFRSPVLGAVALLPMVLTIGWEFGTLRALGWSMDVLVMGISALIIGIGIDYAIHIIHRFREEQRKRRPELQRAIRTTVMQVGTALLAAAATTIGVFGVLALSGMPAIMRFGTLTALVIFFAFVSALVILPSVLVMRERGRK